MLNSFHIKPSKVNDIYYLKILNWRSVDVIGSINKKGIEIKNNLLMPTLNKNIFSVENIKAKLKIRIDNTNSKDHYSKAKLSVMSFDPEIEILLNNIEITLYPDREDTEQVVEFVNSDQELFKINNPRKKQIFNIIFAITLNNTYTENIFYRFHYDRKNNIGDVNGDGVIDLKDLLLLAAHIMEINEITHMQNADINKDGSVDVYDVFELSKRLLNG